MPEPVPPLTRNAARASTNAASSRLRWVTDPTTTSSSRLKTRRRRDAQGDQRPGSGHRRQDGVHPGPVGQSQVDVRRRVVEPTPAERGQPLGQPAYRGVVREPHPGRLEPLTAVDEDLRPAPLTSTSVTPGRRSSGSSGPAPTTSRRSAS